MPLSLTAIMYLSESSPLLRYEHLYFDPKSQSKKKIRNRRLWVESDLRQRRQIQFAVIYRKLRENPSEFFTHLNVSAAIFDYILEQVRSSLANILPDFIPPEEKLYMVLKYLKGQFSMDILAENFGLSTEETEKVLRNTLFVIWNDLQPIHLRTPTPTDLVSLAKEYYEQWHFPNCVGALGGKYIRIKSTGAEMNFKKSVINAVVDANFRILAVFVDPSRRRKDEAFVDNLFNITGMQCLPGTDTKLSYVVIANEGYYIQTNLMVPYSKKEERMCFGNKFFNETLRHARIPIDAAFEILSEKWQVCNAPFTMRFEAARLVVKVCCLLYNIVKDIEGDKDPHFTSFGREDKGCIYLNLVKYLYKPFEKNTLSVALSVRNQITVYIKDQHNT